MSVIALVSISRCLCALTSYELTAPQDVPPVYNLFAISQHSGSLGGGHYTATVQYEGRDWYEFNDSGVSRVDDMDPADSAHSAYVLFYRRQDDLRSSPSKPTNFYPVSGVLPCFATLAITCVQLSGSHCRCIGPERAPKGLASVLLV